MIKKTKGNLLETETEAIVKAVNSVGVMGKGFAVSQEISHRLFQRLYMETNLKSGKRRIKLIEKAL